VPIADVKALVFDVFGTLVDWRSGIAREAAPFLARIGRGDIEPHARGWVPLFTADARKVDPGSSPG